VFDGGIYWIAIKTHTYLVTLKTYIHICMHTAHARYTVLRKKNSFRHVRLMKHTKTTE
jgi:hypothetical protein